MKKHVRSSKKNSLNLSKAQNYTKASSKKQQHKKLIKKRSNAGTLKGKETHRETIQNKEQLKMGAQAFETAVNIPENINMDNYMDDIENHIVELDKKFHQNIESRLRQAGNIQITSQMRKILMKWLNKVSKRFRIKNQSLHICVQLIDSMLIYRGQLFNKTNFQLLGITSLFISCKYNEIYTLDAERYIQLCNGIYSLPQLFEMEGIILTELNFNLQVPTLYQFINKLIFHLKINQQNQALIKAIVDISIFDFNIINSFRKHDLAIVILCFASKVHKMDSLKEHLQAFQFRIRPQIFKRCLVSVVSLFKKNQPDNTNISI